MNNTYLSKGALVRIVVLLVNVIIMASCASLPFEKVNDYNSGTILVLPARDVVQFGEFHKQSEGTGELLTKGVILKLKSSDMHPITTDNANFTHRKEIEKEAALEEARRLQADYCLKMVLGEFLNAAPMTFRPDYVTLADAVMYRVSDGEEVWRITKPWQISSSNFGNHMAIIENISNGVATSIVKFSVDAGKQ